MKPRDLFVAALLMLAAVVMFGLGVLRRIEHASYAARAVVLLYTSLSTGAMGFVAGRML